VKANAQKRWHDARWRGQVEAQHRTGEHADAGGDDAGGDASGGAKQVSTQLAMTQYKSKETALVPQNGSRRHRHHHHSPPPSSSAIVATTTTVAAKLPPPHIPAATTTATTTTTSLQRPAQTPPAPRLSLSAPALPPSSPSSPSSSSSSFSISMHQQQHCALIQDVSAILSSHQNRPLSPTAYGLLVASLAHGGALAAPALRHSGLVDAVKKRLAFGFLPEQKQETTPHPTTDTAANSKTLLPMSKPETKNTATAMSKTETRKKAVVAAGVARRAARLQESAKNAKQVAEELDELLDHSSELVGRLKIDERVSPSRPPRKQPQPQQKQKQKKTQLQLLKVEEEKDGVGEEASSSSPAAAAAAAAKLLPTSQRARPHQKQQQPQHQQQQQQQPPPPRSERSPSMEVKHMHGGKWRRPRSPRRQALPLSSSSPSSVANTTPNPSQLPSSSPSSPPRIPQVRGNPATAVYGDSDDDANTPWSSGDDGSVVETSSPLVLLRISPPLLRAHATAALHPLPLSSQLSPPPSSSLPTTPLFLSHGSSSLATERPVPTPRGVRRPRIAVQQGPQPLTGSSSSSSNSSSRKLTPSPPRRSVA